MVDDSQREDVARLVVENVLLACRSVDHLWSNIARSTASNKHSFGLSNILGQPEVSYYRLDLCLAIASDHYILQFEVPVHYLFLVHVLDPKSKF